MGVSTANGVLLLMAKSNFQYPHEADPDIFREALAYSEADKGFTSTLIEKDYYCSLVLHYFFSKNTLLVFKGGTCLSKVHADFYRLSEDLDLIIPVNDPIDISDDRKQKLDRQLDAQLKPVLRPRDFDGFNLERAFELARNIAEALPA